MADAAAKSASEAFSEASAAGMAATSWPSHSRGAMGIYGVEFDFLFVRRLAEDSADDGDQQKCDDALFLVDTFAYYVLKEFLADYKKIMKTPGVAEQGGPNGRLCAKSELLFPAINVNDYSIKSSPGDVYGCSHSLQEGFLQHPGRDDWRSARARVRLRLSSQSCA
jgi:hypothetical protein